MTKYLLILAALAVSCHSAANADDPVAQCEQGMRAQLDGRVVTFKGYEARFDRSVPGQLLVTIPFAVRDTGVYEAYCVYDADGNLADADLIGF